MKQKRTQKGQNGQEGNTLKKYVVVMALMLMVAQPCWAGGRYHGNNPGYSGRGGSSYNYKGNHDNSGYHHTYYGHGNVNRHISRPPVVNYRAGHGYYGNCYVSPPAPPPVYYGGGYSWAAFGAGTAVGFGVGTLLNAFTSGQAYNNSYYNAPPAGYTMQTKTIQDAYGNLINVLVPVPTTAYPEPYSW